MAEFTNNQSELYTMSLLPVVRYNNFIKTSKPPYVDCVSKFLIFIQFAFGLNRIAVLGFNTFLYLASSILYSIVLISLVITFAYVLYPFSNEDVTGYIKLSKYLASCSLGFLTWKRLQRYYRELNIIDEVIGFRPENKKDSINLATQMVSIISLTALTIYEWECPQYIPVCSIHIAENYFYAHLVILLTRRLRMLNFILETSLVKKGIARYGKLQLVALKHVEITDVGICDIMEAYYVMIDASELLADAIKWQLFMIISITFVATLLWSYWIALVFLQDAWTLPRSFLSLIAIIVTELFPLAMPCIACDGVRAQVSRLRELLSSKLHETKLDKSNRNVTRALLALTETRNLSFSLFRMVDISISLPFSFLGLLATYLIILLQFQKVQNT